MREPCTADPCTDRECYTHGDPIWGMTVRGELDEPEVDLGYHPGEDR